MLARGHTCRKPPASICFFSHFGIIKLASQQEVIYFIAFFLSELLGGKTGWITMGNPYEVNCYLGSDAQGALFL